MSHYKRCPAYPIVATLRRLRVERRISQTLLAEKMGYARETLAYWETHKRLPSLPALEDWAMALGRKLQIGEQAL
jgi:transcriptional regulator with XRE-family HTH domain